MMPHRREEDDTQMAGMRNATAPYIPAIIRT